MKRIISFLIVLATLLGSVCMVSAQDENVTGARESEILKSLGIYDSSKISPTVKRSEFVHTVVRMMGVSEDDISNPSKMVFTDVPTDHPDAGVINYLFKRGIMIGHDDASFKPDSNLTCQEAAKILVSVIGYKELAEATGGYFKGYLSAASDAGILKGVKINYSDEIDSGNLAIMILNTMEADMMTVEINGDGTSISTDKGMTIMGKYLNIGKYTGIVTGCEYTSLESASKSYGEGKAEIGGMIFSVNKVNLDDLIGMNVELYYYDNDGENVLLYAGEKKNTYVTIDRDLIKNVSLEKVEYYKDSQASRTSSFDIEADAVYIYNGKREIMVSKEDLIPDLGNIKLIDNDGNGDADVVIINDYEEFVVKGVVATEERVTTKYGKETLDFSESNNIQYFMDDEIAEFGSITKTSVLNIARSKNTQGEQLIKVYIKDESVSGKVTSVMQDDDEYTIVVDGTEYKLSKECIKNIENGSYDLPKNGNEYEFRLNMQGELADVSIVIGGRKYAYLIKCWFEEEEEKTYIKMYTSDGEFVRTKTRDKVTLNGKKVDGSGLYALLNTDQLIVYELDAEGNISKVQTAEDKTAETWYVIKDDEFVLHSKSTLKDDGTYAGQRFYKNFAENKPYYFVDNKTVYFQIPNDHTKEDDYKIITKLGSTDIAAKGPVYIYDVAEGGAIGAMVAGMLGGSDDYNTPQMVDKVINTVNEDDEECTQIVFVDGSSVILSPKVQYTQPVTSDSKGPNNWTKRIDYSAVTAQDLKRGDVIQCKVVDGYVEKLMVLVCVNNMGPVRCDGDSLAKSGNILGKVLSVNKESSRAIIYYVDRFGDERYQSMVIGGSVFKYDSNTGKADYSTASDIQPGDTVMLNSFWWSIKATFIFR